MSLFNYMKNLLYCLCLLFIAGCSHPETLIHQDTFKAKDPKPETVDEVIIEFLKKVARKEHFEPISFATDLEGEVQKIFIKLQVVRTLNIPQSRKLIIEKAEEFIGLLNRNQSVNQYFHEYPCRISLLTLKIELVKPDCTPEEYPYVSSVRVQSGKIYYIIHNSMKDTDTTTVESYMDAYQIVYM